MARSPCAWITACTAQPVVASSDAATAKPWRFSQRFPAATSRLGSSVGMVRSGSCRTDKPGRGRCQHSPSFGRNRGEGFPKMAGLPLPCFLDVADCASFQKSLHLLGCGMRDARRGPHELEVLLPRGDVGGAFGCHPTRLGRRNGHLSLRQGKAKGRQEGEFPILQRGGHSGSRGRRSLFHLTHRSMSTGCAPSSHSSRRAG